jgi:hypothetical protein
MRGAIISSSDGHDQDPTRRIEMANEPPTSRSGYRGEPLEGEAAFPPDRTTDERPPGFDLDDEEEDEGRRGRDIALLAAGALIGVLFTFVFIALTTGGDTAEVGDDPALAEREAELAEREEEIAELDARIADLEAQLAAAGGDSGDLDDELAAQRDALDERLASVDARAEELDDRQASLDERAEALDQREAAISDAESDAGSPDGDGAGDGGDTGEGDGDGGIDLDQLDELGEDAEGVIDRALEEIRNLFGRD